MKQTTDYPRTDQIEIEVDPAKETAFTIALRIPAWSKIAVVSVNGQPQDGVLQGAYLPVNRKWKKGDRITVKLDLRARRWKGIKRRPSCAVRSSWLATAVSGMALSMRRLLLLVKTVCGVDACKGSWFCLVGLYRPDGVGYGLGKQPAPKQIHFCDFASAGNTWDKTQRYRGVAAEDIECDAFAL